MRTRKPDRASLELDDYSGPFRPDLHLSDFSKEGLMKLVEIGGSIYGAVNRMWYQAAIRRFGQQAADEMHHEVWFADGGCGDHENRTISKLMGFAGDDDETAAPSVSRRDFLRLLGAGAGLAGTAGCMAPPAEKIVPFVDQPPELTPGNPVWYATSCVLDGFATGVLVRANDGRPTKIEGNPEHPASLGASGVFEQASILGLYDPLRARTIRRAGRFVSISIRSTSRLKSSITLNVRNRRPDHNASAMKSADHTSLGRAGTTSGVFTRAGSRRLPRRF